MPVDRTWSEGERRSLHDGNVFAASVIGLIKRLLIMTNGAIQNSAIEIISRGGTDDAYQSHRV